MITEEGSASNVSNAICVMMEAIRKECDNMERANVVKLLIQEDPELISACMAYEKNKDLTDLLHVVSQLTQNTITAPKKKKSYSEKRVLPLVKILIDDKALTTQDGLILCYLIANHEPVINDIFGKYLATSKFDELITGLKKTVDTWKKTTYQGAILVILNGAIEEGLLEDNAYELAYLILQNDSAMLAAVVCFHDDHDSEELKDTLERILKLRKESGMLPQENDWSKIIVDANPMYRSMKHLEHQKGSGSGVISPLTGWQELYPFGSNSNLSWVDGEENLSFTMVFDIMRGLGDITEKHQALLLHLAYNNNPAFSAAWSLYNIEKSDPLAWNELYDTIQRLLKRHSTKFLYARPIRTLYENSVLSQSERDYLFYLLRKNDESLMNILNTFEKTYDEFGFVESIFSICGLWREKSPHSDLLHLIDSLLENGRISMAEADVLENAVFHNDQILIEAYKSFIDDSSSSSNNDARSKFYDILLLRVSEYPKRKTVEYIAEAHKCLQHIHSLYWLSEAQALHIKFLITRKDKRILSLFKQYEETQDVHTLFNNVVQLSSSWSAGRSEQQKELMRLIMQLVDGNVLPHAAEEVLMNLIYKQNYDLFLAFDTYKRDIDSVPAWIDFRDSLVHIVMSHSNLKLATSITHCLEKFDELKQAELISLSDWFYLSKLAKGKDEVLKAIFTLYEEDKCYEEFQDSLQRLACRWKRRSPYEPFLHYIRSAHFLKSECQIIDLLVYQKDSTVLAAWDRYVSTRKGGDVSVLNNAITWALNRAIDLKCSKYVIDLHSFICYLRDSKKIPPANAMYLLDLVNIQDSVLFNAFCLFASHKDYERNLMAHPDTEIGVIQMDLEDTLIQLGQRWLKNTSETQKGLLKIIQTFRDCDTCPQQDYEDLHCLIFKKNIELEQAFEMLKYSKIQNSEFWVSCQAILATKEIEQYYHQYSQQYYEYYKKRPKTQTRTKATKSVLQHALEYNVVLPEYTQPLEYNVVLPKKKLSISTTPHDALLQYLRSLRSAHFLTSQEMGFLEKMVYNGHRRILDISLLAQEKSGQQETIQMRTMILDILESAFYRTYKNTVLNAKGIIKLLHQVTSLPTSDYLYLNDLCEDEDLDPVLVAAITVAEEQDMEEQPEQTRDNTELFDTLTRLGRRWQKRCNRRTEELLFLSRFLHMGNHIDKEQKDIFNTLVYLERESLQMVSDLYDQWAPKYELGDHCKPWKRLLNCTLSIINKEENRQTRIYIKQAQYYIVRRVEMGEINFADAEYVRSLCEDYSKNTVLIAAFAEWEFSKDANELYDTVVRLSKRWRKLRSPGVKSLLTLIDDLVAAGAISSEIEEELSYLAYLEDPVLLAAHSLYFESQSNKSELIQHQEWIELWDTIVRVLNRNTAVKRVHNNSYMYGCLEKMVKEDTLTRAENQYLDILLLNPERDIMMDAAFFQYLQNHDLQEFQDSIKRIASRWQRQYPKSGLLKYICELFITRQITFEEKSILENLMNRQNPNLILGFLLAEENMGYEQLWDNVCDLLDAELDSQCRANSDSCVAYINSLKGKLILNSCDIMYLLELAHRSDVVLYSLAPFPSPYAFQISKDAILETDGELLDTLKRLGSRWRRDKSDINQISNYLQELLNVKHFNEGVCDVLHKLLYHRDSTLLAAYSKYKKTRNQDKWEKTLYSLVIREFNNFKIRYYEIFGAGGLMLTRAGKNSVDQLFEEKHDCIMSIIAQYDDTEDLNHFVNVIEHLAVRWKKQIQKQKGSPQACLLQLIDTYFARDQSGSEQQSESNIIPQPFGPLESSAYVIPADLYGQLEFMVYINDPVLLAAHSVYTQTGHSNSTWVEFWDTLACIINRRCGGRVFGQKDSLLNIIKKLQEAGKLRPIDATLLKKSITSTNGDVVLEAAVAEYFKTNDFEEFFDTLYRIGSRWRKKGINRVVHQLISQFNVHGWILSKEMEILEQMLYDGNQLILDAGNHWYEQNKHIDETKSGFLKVELSNASTMTVLDKFFEALEWDLILKTPLLIRQATQYLQQDMNLAATDLKYLRYLIRKGTDPVLLSIVSLNSNEEVIDSLRHLATRWRRKPTTAIRLRYIEYIFGSSITSWEKDIIEDLLYNEDSAIITTFDHSTTDAEFYKSFQKVIRHHSQKFKDECSRVAKSYIKDMARKNAISPVGIEYIRDLINSEDEILLLIFGRVVRKEWYTEEEMFDSVRRLSHRWKRIKTPCRWSNKKLSHSSQDYLWKLQDKLLLFISEMDTNQNVKEVLELATYQQDSSLITAFSTYVNSLEPQISSSQKEKASTELWNVISRLTLKDNPAMQKQKNQVISLISQLHKKKYFGREAYLHLLAKLDDPDEVVIDSALSLCTETGDVEELSDTLIHVALAWRRKHPYADLLVFIKNNLSIIFEERNVLEKMIQAKHPAVLAAYKKWRYANKTPLQKDEILKSDLMNVLAQSHCQDSCRLQKHAFAHIQDLEIFFPEVFPSSDKMYLMELAKTLSTNQPDTVLFSCIFEATQEIMPSAASNISEVRDTLLRLGRRWRRLAPQLAQETLKVFSDFLDQNIMTKSEIQKLETLVYSGDSRVLNAYDACRRTHDKKKRQELISKFRQVLGEQFSLESIISSYSHETDNLQQQFLNLVEGLEREKKISEASSLVLKELAIEKNPVVLASYSIYADDFSTDAFDEMWDTLKRLLSNQKAQSVSSKYEDQAIHFIEELYASQSLNSRSLTGTASVYLKDLILQSNPILCAAFRLYVETQDPSEFSDTLIRLSKLWKTASPHQILLGYIDELFLQHNITFLELDFLNTCVYKKNPALLDNFSQAVDDASSLTNEEDKKHHTIQRLWPGVEKILDEQMNTTIDKYCTLAQEFISQMKLARKGNEKIDKAGFAYLQECIDSQDTTIMAAFAEYEDTQTLNELLDTLEKISVCWTRKSREITELCKMMDKLLAKRHIKPHHHIMIRWRLYNNDPLLLAAYYLYQESTDWEELWDTVCRLCRFEDELRD